MLPFFRARTCLSRCAQSLAGGAMPQVRYASTDDKTKKTDEIDMRNSTSMGLDNILNIISPSHSSRNRGRNDSLPSNIPRDAFPSTTRKPIKTSGPFINYSGRTKKVENGDLGAAFRALNTTLRLNNVAKEYRAQKFHEKPSDKRVRLNSQRHRRRFLLGVKRLVNLVKEQRRYL